ncbi:MAG: riboflavin synthase, partial [Phycisphaerales bacterium]|nr:riboflavin synthase [Phycisphaerales bacterium]
DDDARTFDVCLIPETLSRTTMKHWKVGTRVNLEADYLAKLVARIVARSRTASGA